MFLLLYYIICMYPVRWTDESTLHGGREGGSEGRRAGGRGEGAREGAREGRSEGGREYPKKCNHKDKRNPDFITAIVYNTEKRKQPDTAVMFLYQT